MEKVLITGANGYIASNLIPLLSRKNYELHLAVRSNPIKDYNSYVLDIRNSGALEDVVNKVKPNYVIHLAAVGFGNVNLPLEEMIDINFTATRKLAECCQKLPDFNKFIYPSTYMECQGSKLPIKPTDMLIPQSPYALSKSLSTNLFLHLSKTGKLNVNVLRFFSVYGLNDLGFRFIPSLFNAMINDEEIETTSLTQKRDFVYIRDVVALILLSLRKKTTSDVIYNVGNGKAVALRDVASEIKNLFPKSKGKIKIGAKPGRQNEDMCYFADISKTRDEFNWKPKYTIHNGLNETFKSLVDNVEKR